MKLNRSLVLTLFLIATIVFVSTSERQVDAATREFIFNEYTIQVNIDGYPNQSAIHGILDLVNIYNPSGIALLDGITEISITDGSGQLVPWEEAIGILTQVLTKNFNARGPVLGAATFGFVETDSGHHFEILQGSLVGHLNVPMIKTSVALRSQLFKMAVLRAVALEETRYFVENVLADTNSNINPQNFLNLLTGVSKSMDLTDSIVESVIHLRTLRGVTAQLNQIPKELHGLVSAETWKVVNKKVKDRVAKTPLGKTQKITKAGLILNVLTAAVDVTVAIGDAKKKIDMLAELSNQLEVLQGLNSALLFMKIAGDADPAMILGMEGAIDELVKISEDRWKRAAKEGVWEAAPSLASVVGFALGGPLGSVLASEFVEWYQLLDTWKQEVLTLSALATLGNYLHRDAIILRDSRIQNLINGNYANEIGAGFPAKDLISFRENIQAEASAWLYNRLWKRRWNNQSLVGLAEGFSKTVSAWITELRTGIDLREEWKSIVTEDVIPVYQTKEVAEKMPIFLSQLSQVYVPRPAPEITSLADIALIIDSSGSMGTEDREGLRKKAAKFFIQLADPTVQIAIVDFDGTARTFAPLTFANPTGKNDLKNAVDRVDANGGTDIGAGLQEGFKKLVASGSGAKKAGVLLTDGEGEWTQQGVLDYATRGWSIYTIGLGSGVDRGTLETIAAATPEGEYFQVDLNNIQTVYNKILAKTTGKSVIANHKNYINEGQQFIKKVLIDATVDQVDISCTWQGSTIELVLIDPDGRRITPQTAAANPRITYQAAETYSIYTIENPKAGAWQMQATGTDIPPGGEAFNLTVSAASDFATNLLAFDSSYSVGDTIRVGIRVQERTGDTFAAVLGATTAAKILRPDGRIDALNLYDDGSHNDGAASDGVYANNYRSVNKQGTYFIQVSARNGFSREIQEQVVVGRIDNVFIDGSSLTPAAGATLKQAPSTISAVISGPAGRINSNSIVLKVDGSTVSHRYDAVNQRVSYQAGGLSGGSHSVQLSVRDVSGNVIETTWQFTRQIVDVRPPRPPGHYTTWGLPEGAKVRLGKGNVYDVKYSPGGEMLAVASSIGIWLYDAETLQELALFTGHTSTVTSVAFSPDGRTLVGGSADGTVHIWDVKTGRNLNTLKGHRVGIRSVAFSPDGQTFASASFSKPSYIHIWEASTGRNLKTLGPPAFSSSYGGTVNSIVFSPDGKTIASNWSYNNTIQLWDVNTATLKKTLTGHTEGVLSVSFSPDGRTLASGSYDATVRLWDINTVTLKKTLTGHTSSVKSVVFSPDGKTIASGSGDETIRLWDIATGTELTKLTGHTSSVLSVSFSPDGETLASRGAEDTIRLWDITIGTHKKMLTGHTDGVKSVVISPDGKTIARGRQNGPVRLWDINTTLKKTLTGHTRYSPSRGVAFSPNGNIIASLGWQNIRLWDVKTGEHIRTFTGPVGFRCIAFSPDGQILASGGPPVRG